MKFYVFSTVVLLFLASCNGTADKKVPQLANAMCDCFQSIDKELSPAARELFLKMTETENPQLMLQKGMTSLSADESKKLTEQIQLLTNRQSEVFQCIKAFDEKNKKETISNRKEFTRKIFKQMKASGNCTTGAAMMALSLYKTKN